MKRTVGDVPLWKENERFTSARGHHGEELGRTKSVEAPKSTGRVSPLYCSLKKDAKVRPEKRRQSPYFNSSCSRERRPNTGFWARSSYGLPSLTWCPHPVARAAALDGAISKRSW